MKEITLPPRTSMTPEKAALIAEMEALADADLAEILVEMRAKHGPAKATEPARVVDLLGVKADHEVMLRRLDCLVYELTRRVEQIEQRSAGSDTAAREVSL